MKKFLIAIPEMILLFLAAVFGFVQHPFNVEKVFSKVGNATRSMVYDWLIVMFIVYVVLLAIEFAVRRTKTAWIRPTVCFVVVAALGLWEHLGLKTVEIGQIQF